MAELPEREQACPTFDTLYTLAKKLEAGQPACACWYTLSSEAYRDKHRCYVASTGRVAALEKDGLALSDQVLAASGSQVNTITPALVQQYGFPILPLEDLVDYPVNLVGLGGMCTSPLRFVILHMQVWGIAGYDKDAVFLLVPDESNFGQRVPLVVGTCTISRLINIIRKSEIDSLTTLWSTTTVAQLLSCQLGVGVLGPEGAETLEEGACGGSPEVNVDELVMMWESIRLGPFQTEIIEGWVEPLLGSTSYMMITPLKAEG